jgi:hypothetical protein
MGNSLFRSQKISPEEEQRRLQQNHGVLVPPLFTVSNDDGYASSNNGNTTIPISSQAQWKVAAMNNPQNIMTEYLWRLTAGYNLLNEYMTPGIYFAGEYGIFVIRETLYISCPSHPSPHTSYSLCLLL